MSSFSAPPTLDDVARAADVSTATVSRCINTPDLVSQRTRARVNDSITALGYTPNFAARSMAAKRTFTIGAIIPTMENAMFARGLQAFQEELRLHGYTLIVSSSAYRADIEEEQIKTLVARGADGLLLIGHDRDPAIYDYLARQNVPVLVAWSYVESAPVPCIGFDNRGAMRVLVERVIAMGHDALAMISGISEQNDRARLRILGAQDAMRAAGLDADGLRTVEVPYDISAGAEAFCQIMSGPSRPGAVLCGNDVLAAGALRGASGMGLRVPEDVSITGFDDIELAQVVSPALTTMHVPHREMGSLAARELAAMIGEKRKGVSQNLAVRLVERASVGRAPA